MFPLMFHVSGHTHKLPEHTEDHCVQHHMCCCGHTPVSHLFKTLDHSKLHGLLKESNYSSNSHYFTFNISDFHSMNFHSVHIFPSENSLATLASLRVLQSRPFSSKKKKSHSVALLVLLFAYTPTAIPS